MDSGSRSEIVRSDGLRFGKRARSPADQSTRPVESCFVQNARSAASVRNAGIFFCFLLIALPFPPAHVSRRDHPDEVPSDREDDEEPPPRVRAPECVIALLRARVTHVLDDEKRLVEKDLLTFPERDAVQRPVLVEVPPVPIEADTTIKGRSHDLCSVYRGHIRPSTAIEGTGSATVFAAPTYILKGPILAEL